MITQAAFEKTATTEYMDDKEELDISKLSAEEIQRNLISPLKLNPKQRKLAKEAYKEAGVPEEFLKQYDNPAEVITNISSHSLQDSTDRTRTERWRYKQKSDAAANNDEPEETSADKTLDKSMPDLPEKFIKAYEEVTKAAHEAGTNAYGFTPEALIYRGVSYRVDCSLFGHSIPAEKSFEKLPDAQGPYDDILLDEIPDVVKESSDFKRIAYVARLNNMKLRAEFSDLRYQYVSEQFITTGRSNRNIVFHLVKDEHEVIHKLSLEEKVDLIMDFDDRHNIRQFVSKNLKDLTFGKSNEEVAYILERCSMKLQQSRLSKVIVELQQYLDNDRMNKTGGIVEQLLESEKLNDEILKHVRATRKPKRKNKNAEQE